MATLAAIAVVIIFSFLPTVQVPLGILTALEPAVAPLILLEPPVLAMALIPACFSDASSLEATSGRRVRAWHAGVLAAMIATVTAALCLQPNVPDPARASVVISYLGSVGLALLGAAVLGGAGWLLPAAYTQLLAPLGARGFGDIAVWAWSMQPPHQAAPTAAILLTAGAATLGWRWSHHPAPPTTN